MKKRNTKFIGTGIRFTFYFLLFTFPLLLSGCATFQAAGAVQRGRLALLKNDYDTALAKFQRASKLDPDYTFNSPFDQSVWSYIGRAYYAMGNFPEARRALERARKEHPQDSMAPLYLGLALVRQGQKEQGHKEITVGLDVLRRELLRKIYTDPYGHFWDPSQKIETELNQLIAMTEDKPVPGDGFLRRVERIGKNIEQEIDEARHDKDIDRRDSDDDGPTG